MTTKKQTKEEWVGERNLREMCVSVMLAGSIMLLVFLFTFGVGVLFSDALRSMGIGLAFAVLAFVISWIYTFREMGRQTASKMEKMQFREPDED